MTTSFSTRAVPIGRSPSLRGLAGDQVLVMLNGKRYNRSALVQVYGGSDTGLGRGAQGADISAIPSLAIRSLQVLREGATAQYGSDAIAGVLNYGLREDSGDRTRRPGRPILRWRRRELSDRWQCRHQGRLGLPQHHR